MDRHEIAETLARFVHRALFDQTANFDREPRIVRQRRVRTPPAAGADRGVVAELGRVDGQGTKFATHKGLRCDRACVYSPPREHGSKFCNFEARS